MLKAVCAMAILVVLTGCSDPREASEKNFKNAAQAYLDTIYPKCYFNQNFPVTADYAPNDERYILPHLVKAGLIAEQELSRKEVNGWGLSSKKKLFVKSTFELTEEGRSFYKDDVSSTMGGKVGGFCIGKAEVKEIIRFTEPADIFGHRMASVNYTYTVGGLPDWAKSPNVGKAIPELKTDAGSNSEPVKRVDGFILTNNGWIHERLFNK